MIGIKETQMIYDLPPHYIKMLIGSVLEKDGLRSKMPLVGDKIGGKSKLKSGITLLGGRIGQGKTSTINILIDEFEKQNVLSGFTVAYLNTKQIKDTGANFIDKANKLIRQCSVEKVLVVIDQIDCRESMLAGIMLAKAGFSVIGLVSVKSDRYISNVLNSAVKGAASIYEKDLITSNLLEHLNALVMQNQNHPMAVQYLQIDKKMAAKYSNILEKDGVDYLYKQAIDGDKSLIIKEWDSKNWNKK